MVTITYYSLFLLAALALFGCQSMEEPEKAKMPVNSFSMLVSGREWKPYQVPTEPCNSTFMAMTGEWRGTEVVPFYEIHAYRDPDGRHDAYSENLLRMAITNTTKPGTYVINGTYKSHFDSYVVFQRQGRFVRYVNNASRRPFVVHIDEFLKTDYYTPAKGMRGMFWGVLYNEDNLSDSLVISEGKFTFRVVNVAYGSQYDL